MRANHLQLTATGSRIIDLLNKSISEAHLRQIQAQLLLKNLHADSIIAHHFINASQILSLLPSSLPILFTRFTRPHVFTCNTLIKAFSHAQIPHVPFSIYLHMHNNAILPNNYTFPFLLKSLSDSGDFMQSQSVHAHVVKFGFLNDIYVSNALLNVYASCGRMALCRKMFDEMPMRDVVSWTVLIMGYRNAGKYDDALLAFEMMQYACVVPNHVTMVNVLGACAAFGASEMGVWIHDFIKRNGWELDVILGTSLIDMYLKCGRLAEGLNVFRSMKEKNIFTWNTVIKGLALAKCGQEAVWWFNRMQQEGLTVDEVTLVNVLSACSHSGLVDVGKHIFGSLINGRYGFSPNAKHYSCMIDLLARSGYLDEAFKCIRDMPFEPTKSIWGSLLTGCRVRGNLELSEFVAKKLVELEPENGAYYVVLSNLYAEMGRWSDVEKVREVMKERGLKKDLGCSSVEPKLQEQDYYLLAQ